MSEVEEYDIISNEPDYEDEYEYLDEDDCDPRYEDMRCFPEDYRYDD